MSKDNRTNKEKLKSWTITGITVVFMIFGALFLIDVFTPKVDGYSEITEYMTLDSQYFCSFTSQGCENCYCFNGTYKSCLPGNCGFCYGVLKKDEGDYRVLFFAEEYDIHPEWEKGDLLQVTWKPTVYGWRVRGVTKYE